jgi:mannosyl-oligosaccharide glucosidase
LTLSCSIEVILKTILEHGRDVVTPYTNQQKGMPDPSYVLSLPNDVLYGSNVFGVQKHFDGPFQFDVIFDSASNTQKITRTTIIFDSDILH